MRALSLAAALAFALGCARPVQAPPGGEDRPPELALPSDVRPLRYALELTVLPDREGFEGAVAIDVELARPLSRLWLHARDLTVREATVEVGGLARPATLQDAGAGGVARLAVATPLPAGRATVHLRFEGVFAEGGPGLARAAEGGRAYAFARLGAGEARRAFPCFDDPALQAPFEVALTVPADAVALSTGAAASEEPLAGGLKRVRFAPTPPIPAHLLALAVGPFEVEAPPPLAAGGPRAGALQVRLLRPRGAPAGDFGPALEAARQLAPLLEVWLATPFPYPRLDVVAVPAADGAVGAAAGVVLAPAARLAAPRDGEPVARELPAGALLARALARQWFEGLVAPAAPDDAWLPGGLAALLERVALERWRPEARRADDEARAVAEALRSSALAVARPLRPPPRTGAAGWPALDAAGEVHAVAVLRGLERLLGEERFRAGLAAHLAEHARGAASTDALAAALSRAGGRDVGAALRAGLDEPGAPLVVARSACDAAGARVELTAGRYRPIGSRAAPLASTLPVCARFEAGGALGERCTVVERGRGSLALPACPRWIMPDAGGRSWLTFALGAADVPRLRDAGFAHLAAPERVALGASVLADAEAGRLAFGEALDALAPLARDGAPAVALLPAEAFQEAADHLVPDAARPRARAALAELYRPRLRALGLAPAAGEDPERRALRAALARVLVAGARDPEAVHALAGRGAVYARPGEGRFRADAVSPELAPVALEAAVLDGDVATFDALVRRLLDGLGGDERRQALAAVGAARDAALAERVLALAAEPRLPAPERLALLRDQAAGPETRDGAWKVLQSRWAELAVALPPDAAAALPRVAASLCDRKRLEEARRFFESRLAKLPSASAAAAETLERIEGCVALREVQGASAAAYFEAR
ncbi:M1 family metallopeptidase [Anaeromyxobacter diazotrophicus]|nr:M1 family metallopeptidase [Anaeromyxobacter diazotrophicus]